MRNMRYKETIMRPLIECLLNASAMIELSQAIWTNPPLHISCHSMKAWRIVNNSFQSIFLDLWYEGIRSEKTILLCIPSMSFASLASVVTSKETRDNWIIEIKDQDLRNWSYQWRSSYETRLNWIRWRWHRVEIWQIWEKRLRRNERSREMTW